MKFLKALELNKSQTPALSKKICILSSLNLELLKIFLDAHLKSQNVFYFIDLIYGNINLELNKKNFHQYEKILIILDWEDFIHGSSLRSFSPINVQTAVSYKKNIASIAKTINFFNKSNLKKVFLIKPFNRCFLDLYELNYLNNFSLSEFVWNEFVKSVKNVNFINDFGSILKLDAGMLYKSAWPISTEDTDKFANFLSKKIINDHYDRIKIIITDLDNTLWGGVIGEDGCEALEWGNDESNFKFSFYQKFLNFLSSRGFILSVCSKNDYKKAVIGLKRKDIHIKFNKWTSIKCGWNSKSEKIKDLLKELNLGDDSFLFIDDTDFEINEVKNHFPKANFLKFPSNNSELSSFLEKLIKLTQVSKILKEDIIRKDSYIAKAKIEKISNQKHYLKKIKMKLSINKILSSSELRPFQLLNKTNQFNLNGIRENENKWKSYFKKNHYTVTASLKDIYADHGAISLLRFRINQRIIHVDSFVLSCRVFSRNVECGILDWLIDFKNKKNFNQIVFNFRDTNKNNTFKKFLLDYLAPTKNKSNYSYEIKSYDKKNIFTGSVVSFVK
jgi:FkbH-like protein